MQILGPSRPSSRISGGEFEFLIPTLSDSEPHGIENQSLACFVGSLAPSPSFSSCVILGRLPNFSELPKMGKVLTPTLKSYQASCLGMSLFLSVIRELPGDGQSVC